MGVIDRNPNHFYAHVQRAFQGIGFDVQCVEATEASMKASFDPDVYCLFHRNTPCHPHAIEVRPAPMGPFWMLDKTADPTQKRVFNAKFQPAKTNVVLARDFTARLIVKHGQIESGMPRQDGFILAAMQGGLERQRFWQSMSPLEMLKQTIESAPEHQILIKLHPGQTYSDQEMDAVNAFVDGERVQVVGGDLNGLLDQCAFTVSMNSTVTVKGLLFGKGGVLFGDADFHHPFQSVREHGVRGCFDRVEQKDVEADKYLLWYLRRQHIANYKASVEQDILQRCAILGWALGDIE
jgi:hypothetical protein